MSTHKIVSGLMDVTLRSAARYSTYIGCGSCKGGTGWVHEWNKAGDLVPVEPPTVCPHCDGTGKIRLSDTAA